MLSQDARLRRNHVHQYVYTMTHQYLNVYLSHKAKAMFARHLHRPLKAPAAPATSTNAWSRFHGRERLWHWNQGRFLFAPSCPNIPSLTCRIAREKLSNSSTKKCALCWFYRCCDRLCASLYENGWSFQKSHFTCSFNKKKHEMLAGPNAFCKEWSEARLYACDLCCRACKTVTCLVDVRWYYPLMFETMEIDWLRLGQKSLDQHMHRITAMVERPNNPGGSRR